MITIISPEGWDIIKIRLKRRYRQLQDHDLDYAEGHEEDLIARILNRTGVARDEIERLFREEHWRRSRVSVTRGRLDVSRT